MQPETSFDGLTGWTSQKSTQSIVGPSGGWYPRRMILVGLTGGLATGKSTVARLFEQCGAHIIDADLLARRVVEPGKPAWRDVVKTFGRHMLNSDRTLNRTALGKAVFGRPRRLRTLERIIHPRVAREQARLTREIAKHDPKAIIMYDAPVLIEAGAHRRMDRIIVVTADQKTQIARLSKRNGLSRAEALRRIHSQLPLTKKVPHADYIVDGCLPLNALASAIRSIFTELQESA